MVCMYVKVFRTHLQRTIVHACNPSTHTVSQEAETGDHSDAPASTASLALSTRWKVRADS